MRQDQGPTLVSVEAWRALRTRATLAGHDYALFRGEARSVLSSIPTASVNTCLTSPPYWQARDYNHPDQIGLELDAQTYVDRLVEVFREVRRVLTTDGTAWLNLGDCYLHGVGTVDGRPPATGWRRNKQLALLPFRVALALEEDGWWIRNAVIWHKPNAMPSSVRDRLTATWEPIFMLTKSEHYFFNLDAIRVPHETDDEVERVRATRRTINGKAQGKAELRKWLNSPRHRSTIEGFREIDRRPGAPRAIELAAFLRDALSRQGRSIDWVAGQLDLPFERTRHYFRTDALGSRLPPPEVWDRLKDLLDLDDRYDEAMTVEVGDNVFRNHPLGRNPGDMWPVSVRGGAASHFATMPLPLAERALKATLPKGGACLDPFMGTGTTGFATLRLGGRFVGVDIDSAGLDYFSNEVEATGRLPLELEA
jgi:DNA modification methylase